MPRVCQETVSSRCLFEEVPLALDKSGKSVRRLPHSLARPPTRPGETKEIDYDLVFVRQVVKLRD